MVLSAVVALTIFVLALVGIAATRALRMFVRSLWPH
jgi:hypothetical protein